MVTPEPGGLGWDIRGSCGLRGSLGVMGLLWEGWTMFRSIMTRLTQGAIFVGIMLAVLVPATAWADGGGTQYPTPHVPTCAETPQGCAPQGVTASHSVSRGASLPFTGGDTALLTVVGLGVVGGGVGLLFLSRRRRTASA
jgi:LPXTG-motif cell wall-anchored protein